MKRSKVAQWFQVGVSLSVLVGVFLVVWEVKQNNTIAAYERIAQVNEMWGEVYRFEFENDIWLLHKKSIESPKELTDQEILQLDSWLSMTIELAVLNDLQNRVHGLTQPNADLAAAWAESYFGSHISRAWLKENKHWSYADAPDFIDRLLEEIEKTPVQTEFDYLQRLRSH